MQTLALADSRNTFFDQRFYFSFRCRGVVRCCGGGQVLWGCARFVREARVLPSEWSEGVEAAHVLERLEGPFERLEGNVWRGTPFERLVANPV